MKVLITGATGLIGQEIVSLLHANNVHVNYLTTSTKKLKNEANYKGFYWNPKAGEIDADCLDGVIAIINLVGASVSKRWSKSYKKVIIESRTKTAQLLLQTLKENKHSIKQVISASAIGIYPDSQINYYDETYKGYEDSFLGEVVNLWEEAVDVFKEENIKVCKIRIGLVLSEKGGALPEIIRPIKIGAGAAFGSGNQWQSWIHVNDLAKLFIYALEHQMEGVINGVAPNPITNKEFTKIAAKVLNKPLILPNVPRGAMKLVLGEMHTILFASQRVSSKKIEDLGFEFQYNHLEPALQDLLQ